MLNFVGLPGNWLIIAIVGVWVWLGPERFQFPWVVLVALIALALIGEAVEFATSVLGTKKMGGSSRGATLSVIGSIIGGLIGAVIGIPVPIPIIGILIGSILFASIGAMVGAMAGEYWIGTPMKKSVKIGSAAFVGRALGTVGKITMGSAMVALTWVAPFVW